MSPRARLVALIALLAALSLCVIAALPAYRDYATRREVAEGLQLAMPYKNAVAAVWRSNGQRFADIDADSFRPLLERAGKYVRSVDVVSGAIVITYGRGASAPLRGRSLTIVPALSANRAIEWQCGYGAAPPGFEAIFDTPSRFTDVPEEHLPLECRR
jgi:type IV pilus assembly protein PilA